ncbi:MAG: hypothetical protein QG622_1171 [Actinomycetota bacterium]|nr:hypothetical protein [Actinomycetota bacterium]
MIQPTPPPATPADGTPQSGDRLALEQLPRIVDEVARLLGLDPTGAARTKFTNNAVMLLPASRAVLRIPGSPVMRARVPAVLAAAQWYADHDLPAVRLWPGLTQPLQIGPHLVTVWQQVTPGGPDPHPTDLGTILRAIHTIDAPIPDLPQWRITDGIRRRVTHADTIDEETRDYLAAELRMVEASLTGLVEIPPLIPPGVIHGDAHTGNLIPSPTGPVICDFDATSIGPREWDLTPAAVGSLRFAYPVNPHRALVDTYGLDVTTWPGFPALRRLRELQLVTSVLPTLDINPALRPQWRHRLNTFRSDDCHAKWTPYAEVSA